MIEQRSRIENRLRSRLRIRIIAADIFDRGVIPLHRTYLRILGEIKHNRSRTTGRGKIEGTSHSPRNLFG